METKKLKDLYFFHPKSKIKAGEGLEEGEYPFYTSSSKLTKWINNSQLNTRALIFGTGGKASIHFADGRFSFSTDCIAASSKQQFMNIKFVYYYFFGNINVLEKGFKGAGLKHISKNYIENLDIPILPLESQNKIVTVLDKAHLLVEKKEQSISLLDVLLRATFLDMFGDPFINPKKFNVDILENLCEFITKGSTPKSTDIHDTYFEDSVPFLKVYHIAEDGGIDFDYKPSFVSSEIHNGLLKRSIVRPNDVLMNIVGPPLGKIGLVSDYFEEWNINQAIVFFRTKSIISPKYLLNALRSKTLLKSITDQAVGVRQQNISLKQCRGIQIPIPPVELQLKFCAIYNVYSHFLEMAQVSLYELNNLQSSLFQKAFNGGLNLNFDIELDALLNEVDLQKKRNDLSKIVSDFTYLQRLVDKLNSQEFKERELYDKAKHAVFQLLKEDKKIEQIVRVNKIGKKEVTSIKLVLK